VSHPPSGQPSDVIAKLQHAITHHQAGDLRSAERLYREILALQPRHADANHNLGVLALQAGAASNALPYLKLALESEPSRGQYWISYANALRLSGDIASARSVLDTARQRGLQGPAADELAAQLDAQAAGGPCPAPPASPAQEAEVLIAVFDRRNHSETEAAARAFVARHPRHPVGWKVLGAALHYLGRNAEAVQPMAQAALLAPNDSDAFTILGVILTSVSKLEDAKFSHEKALQIRPDNVDALSNLALTLIDMGRFTEAQAHLKKALRLRPGLAALHLNLGKVYTNSGRLDQAEACYRDAIALEPNAAATYSNLLFALNYHPDKSGRDIYSAYVEYDRRFGAPIPASAQPATAHAGPRRRLKVGYVSPDFRRHSVGYFLEPLLAGHDRAQFEVHAYAELPAEDATTQRYKSLVEHWIATAGLSDDELARRIRADGIDILVDIAGHTRGNRLPVFAHKPAPVSVSWLGFGYTTGLTTIDYFLTDATVTPQGEEDLFSERPWRLDGPPFVYRPPPGMGEVSSLPALQNGYITFGSLSRAIRLNHHVIRVWSDILKHVGGSRLVIDSMDFQDSDMQQELAARFAAHGIARDRLTIGYHTPPWDVLRGMDISLDCFPHNSGTTLFESLYMGVPFVTLAGRPGVGRLGSSILNGLGRTEWIAQTEAQYVDIAVQLAHRVEALDDIRATLRQQMAKSVLMHEKGFAREVEAAYLGMMAATRGQ
jgi:predicted O-linked N-acetylglucosamine transferase (SPINDLY family)